MRPAHLNFRTRAGPEGGDPWRALVVAIVWRAVQDTRIAKRLRDPHASKWARERARNGQEAAEFLRRTFPGEAMPRALRGLIGGGKHGADPVRTD